MVMKLEVIFLFLILFSVTALAEARIVYPVEAVVEDGGTVLLGEVSAGQTFVVSVNPNATAGTRELDADLWDQLVVVNAPSGWVVSDSDLGASVLTSSIEVPKSAQGSYGIIFKVFDNGNDIPPHTFTVGVKVVGGLSSSSLINPFQVVDQGGSVSFSVNVFNNSLADDEILITTNLPASWASSRSFSVPALSSASFDLEVVPVGSGERNFNISLVSLKSGDLLNSFDAKLITRSTVIGGLTASAEGPMVFPFNLNPFYGLIGFIFSLF